MSIWGKILGGAAGFAIGGPIGALIGAIAGHAVDRRRGPAADGSETPFDESATRRMAFTIAVIVLGAKMAKADGQVTQDEVRAFKQVFRVPENEMSQVGMVFNKAKRDSAGFEPYARQMGKMFAGQPAVLSELLSALFHIAGADGTVGPAELDYLRRVAHEFGFDEHEFERVRAEQMGPDAADPYEVLGVARDATDAEVKSAYRKLIRENHPDTLMAQGLPQEFIDLANERMATINAAYDKVETARGMT